MRIPSKIYWKKGQKQSYPTFAKREKTGRPNLRGTVKNRKRKKGKSMTPKTGNRGTTNAERQIRRSTSIF